MEKVEISLSKDAIHEAKKLIVGQNTPHLRLYIEGKGCDGFIYGVCFDEKNSEDLSAFFDSFSIIIDPETYKFCRGSTIDWGTIEGQSGFIVNNPNHKKFRGKGTKT